jgi:hypothetical protein
MVFLKNSIGFSSRYKKHPFLEEGVSKFYAWIIQVFYVDNVNVLALGLKPRAIKKALPLRGRYEDKGPFSNKKKQQKQNFCSKRLLQNEAQAGWFRAARPGFTQHF